MEAALASAARSQAGGASLETLLATPSVTVEVLNKPASLGVTALHILVWRNHLGRVSRLLAAGADPNVTDHESGWSSVHSALHWGNLQVLAALLQHDGDLLLGDWKGRTPVDLVSAELKEYLGPGTGDVFSWGNGNNYTLGTGSTHVQLSPSRIESLHDAQILLLSAAKFHSAAVSLDGKLYTWGWGRGGRLGHPEAHIHSGESAVIAPRLVTSLGKRQVLAVAAAKHHTVFCTTAGEVYTMGSNRHGQLGYAVDTQPTPRRVGALRARVVSVAAANKHSVAVAANGGVFTWGCNVLGQLGYGTSDSISNANPRLVDAMKGKAVQRAAAAKRHTVVLTVDGEVYTWGHRGVSPRRVLLAGTRDVLSSDGAQLWFHRGHQDVFRPQAVAVCAGAAHTCVLTRTGIVLCWRSADPALMVQEVGGMLGGKRVVSISAGKYRTAAVTDEGDVYIWEGRSDYFPAEGRQSGSGSKKADKGKGRPIPGSGLSGVHTASSLGGSPSPAEVGSYGSQIRKGSYFDRYVRDREGVQPSGLSLTGKINTSRPTSGNKADVFAAILPTRVEGLKRAVSVSVGEKHSLALQRWSAAQLPGLQQIPWLEQPACHAAGADEVYTGAVDSILSTPRGEFDSETNGAESAVSIPERAWASPSRHVPRRIREPESLGVPSLQHICEEEVARELVDPRTTLQVLEYADVAGADLLRAYCLAVAVCNLDAVLLEARGAVEELPQHLLAELERLWKLRLSGHVEADSCRAALPPERGSGMSEEAPPVAAEPAGPEQQQVHGEGVRAAELVRRVGSRLQPCARPTSAQPSLGFDEDELTTSQEIQASHGKLVLRSPEGQSSFKDKSVLHAEAASQRLARSLQKKLQQIESLEQRVVEGAQLDVQQTAKVKQRPVIITALAALEAGMPAAEVQVILKAASSERKDEHRASSSSRSSSASTAAAAAVKKGGSSLGGKGSQVGSAQKAGRRSTPAAVATPMEGAVPTASAGSEEGATAAGLSGLCLEQPAFDTMGSSSSWVEQHAPDVGFDDNSSLLGSSPAATVPAFGPLGHASQRATGEPETQVVGGFRGLDEARPPFLEKAKSCGPKSKEKSKRKGGLSMFLRGDLEKPATPPPPASGQSQGTSLAPWGSRAQAPVATTSLKEILTQEAAATGPLPACKPPTAAPVSGSRGTPRSTPRIRPFVVDAPTPAQATGSSGLRMSLATFMTSSPLHIQRAGAEKPPAAAWGGPAGSSPPATHSDFRRIQEQQQAAAAARSFGTSPAALHRPVAPSTLPPWRPPPGIPVGPCPSAGVSTGAGSSALLGSSPTAGSSLLGTSPSGRAFNAAPKPQHSKWYVPEERGIKSIRSIQTEETAVKELAKLYGSANVRIVRKERSSPGLPNASAVIRN